MPLSGTLDAFSLDEVLEWLAHARKTGALRVDQPDHVGGVVYFAGGRFCGAESGELTGKVDASEELEARIIDVCFALLRVDGGGFEFEPDCLPSWPVGAGLDVAPVLDHVRGLVRDWSAIEAVIPSPNARPLLARNLNRESIQLERDTWSVVTTVDGHKNVREIARTLGRSVLDVSGVLKGLVEAGAAEMVGERHATDGPVSEHVEVPDVSVALAADEVAADEVSAEGPSNVGVPQEVPPATPVFAEVGSPRRDVTPFTMEELKAAQAEAQRSVEKATGPAPGGPPRPERAGVGPGELADPSLLEAGAEAAAFLEPQAGTTPGRTILAEALTGGGSSGTNPPEGSAASEVSSVDPPSEPPQESEESDTEKETEKNEKEEPESSREPGPLSARERGEALRMFSSLHRS